MCEISWMKVMKNKEKKGGVLKLSGKNLPLLKPVEIFIDIDGVINSQ